MNKKTLIIDGNNFSNLETFYDEIDNVFTKDINWKTGHNLDALNDLLCGGFGVTEIEEPIILIWKNSAKSKTDLGYIVTKNYYEERILNCHPTNKKSFEDTLKEVENEKGQTLFDILLEIIYAHDHIELQLV